MSTVINTNMFSIYAQTQSQLTHRSEQTSMERLSSGARINEAKDDAAGIAFSAEILHKIDGLSVGLQNANDGVSMVQVADSVMEEITTVIHRMRELTLQGGSGTLSGEDYRALQSEFSTLQDGILEMVERTKFNGHTVLNRPEGVPETIGLHVGTDSDGATVEGLFTGMAVTPDVKSSESESGLDGIIRGRFTGRDLAGEPGVTEPLPIAVNQQFIIELDGVESQTVTVVAGDRQKGEWAAEIQDQINADATLIAAGKSVTVNYNEAIDKFEIDSNFTGATSTVKLKSTAADLGLHHVLGVSSQQNIEAVSGFYQGFEMAGSAGATENASVSQDSAFTVLVDGVISSSINLTPTAENTQSKADWAAALQTAINEDAALMAASKSVTAVYDVAKDAITITSDSGGSSSRVWVTEATESMATLGIAPTGQEVELISLEGVETSGRQLTFSVDGTEQPQITLPETTKTVAEWATQLESQLTGIQVNYDADSKQYLITSDAEGYGSEVSFTGSIEKLGLTVDGETRNGYSNINEIQLNHYDLDDPSHAIGDLLQKNESIASFTDTSAMLNKIDLALEQINEVRGHYGAVENRLLIVSEYMGDIKVKSSDAYSKMNDADFALESAELARANIISQTTTAMMAQANQTRQQVLQLFN